MSQGNPSKSHRAVPGAWLPRDAEPVPITQHPQTENSGRWMAPGLPGALEEPGRSRAVEHRPWRTGTLQAEGDLEHPPEDVPTSLVRCNGSTVPQFP